MGQSLISLKAVGGPRGIIEGQWQARGGEGQWWLLLSGQSRKKKYGTRKHGVQAWVHPSMALPRALPAPIFTSGAGVSYPSPSPHHKTIMRLIGRRLDTKRLQTMLTRPSCAHPGHTVIICVPVCLDPGTLKSAFVPSESVGGAKGSSQVFSIN